MITGLTGAVYQALSNNLLNTSNALKGNDSKSPLTVSSSSISSAISTGKLRAPDFGQVLNNFVSEIDQSQKLASLETKKVLLGESDNIHESVIAMQKASVSFNLMVEMRNKLVECYQEIMKLSL